MKHLAPLQLAESLRHKKDFVWLDSLIPQASHSPQEEGLSLLAAEPDLIIEGGPNDWLLLEEELSKRMNEQYSRNNNSLTKKSLCKLANADERQEVGSASTSLYEHTRAANTGAAKPIAASVEFQEQCGAAIGFFRYDGSFRFGFYEKVYRHIATKKKSTWLTPIPQLKIQRPKSFTKNSIPAKAETENLHLPLDFQDHMTRADFCKIVREAQREIALGNIYQICLAHRFQATFQDDPWSLYLSLRQHSPAPFAAYLHHEKETILSSSPECFLKIDGRHILTRPIKGTRPRGKNPGEDAEQASALQASLKENAELVMITDLERNDLGRVCDYGSVVTSQLLHLEPYPQVFHLVSTVEGQLRKEISHVQAVASCFPGGSISGAPKKKAMEIIQRLETVPRDIFTGAIGYFGFDGKSQFNITIRTLHLHDGVAQFHVGAGITSDSIPEQEWEETLHKAAGILTAARSRCSAAVEVES